VRLAEVSGVAAAPANNRPSTMKPPPIPVDTTNAIDTRASRVAPTHASARARHPPSCPRHIGTSPTPARAAASATTSRNGIPRTPAMFTGTITPA